MTSTEIKSISYIYNVNPYSAKKDIYTLFQNTIASNVSNPKGTKIWIFHSDNDYTGDITKYPVLIIGSPQLPTDMLTMNKKRTASFIQISVYSTSKKQLDELSSKIQMTIYDNRRTFMRFNITGIELSDEDDDFQKLNKTDGRHVNDMIFSFNYTFKQAW